jgi:hypothetical protein
MCLPDDDLQNLILGAIIFDEEYKKSERTLCRISDDDSFNKGSFNRG